MNKKQEDKLKSQNVLSSLHWEEVYQRISKITEQLEQVQYGHEKVTIDEPAKEHKE